MGNQKRRQKQKLIIMSGIIKIALLKKGKLNRK